MQKTFVMGLLAMSLALTGCFNKDKAAEAPVPQKNDQASSQESKEPVKLSLSEWFQKQEGVKCDVQAPTGPVAAWIYKNKVRIEGVGFNKENPQEIGHMISDGDWIYTWAGTSGVKFNIKEMANQVQGANAASKPENWQDVVAKWENSSVGYDCQNFELNDDFYKLPEGIAFSDVNALLNVSTSSVQTLMNDLPADVKAGTRKGEAPKED